MYLHTIPQVYPILLEDANTFKIDIGLSDALLNFESKKPNLLPFSLGEHRKGNTVRKVCQMVLLEIKALAEFEPGTDSCRKYIPRVLRGAND